MTRIALVLLLLLPGFAMAQPVVLRGGEHGDYTRLVFDLPPNTDWSVTQDPETRAIAVTLGALAVDTSEAFNRINRARVADISVPEQGRVDIALACDCIPESFETNGSLLVVDVKPALSSEPAEVAANAAPPLGAEEVTERTDNADVLDQLSSLRLGATPGIGPLRASERAFDMAPLMAPTAAEATSVLRLPDAGDSPQLRSDLAESLASAASTGLLNPAFSPSVQDAADRSDKGRVPEGAQGAEDRAPNLPQELIAGLRDLETEGGLGRRIDIGDDRCKADLDLTSWAGEDAENAPALIARRSEIYGEFDKTQTGALSDYIRAMLYLGFGAEARVALDNDMAKDDPVLRALSYLVDGVADPTGRFRDALACEGPAAFWAVLSVRPDDAVSVNTSAVLTTFETLPLHLREHLGPDVAERLSKAGYPEAGHSVLRRLARAKGETDEEILLGQTRIDLDHGETDMARNRLAQIPVPSAKGQEAVVAARVVIAEATGEDLSDRDVELAETFALEARNTEHSETALETHVRALILASRWADAFEALSEPGEAPDEARASMHRLFLARVTEQAEDFDFLRYGLGLVEQRDIVLPPDLGQLMARRLLDTGLYDAALALAARFPGSSDEDAKSLIEAEAQLGLGRPDDAEIALIGLRGETAARLRAEARRQMGDHDLAKEIFNGLEDRENANTSAWLSGDWDTVRANQEGAFTETAELVSSPDNPFDPQNDGLAEARQLAEESRNARAVLQELMEATPVE